jgi:hypothetical protein
MHTPRRPIAFATHMECNLVVAAISVVTEGAYLTYCREEVIKFMAPQCIRASYPNGWC